MPPSLHPQTIIALIWDFDKTLTHSYMQDPLFAEFQVDPTSFWNEVNSLEKYYQDPSLPGGPARVGKDTVYLNHILTYVRDGVFPGLTNDKLRELGSRIVLAPGLPDFFDRSREIVNDSPYLDHKITVEHYIVSTGLRPMIEGSALAQKIDGIWACELLPAAPAVGSSSSAGQASPVVSQIGYTVDNTSKTRAVFEINKGVNKNPEIDVNSVVPDDERRVPIRNMIYIADGPSDVPCFSLVQSKGGKTLGVYAPGARNYDNAAALEEQGRVNSIAEADYSPDSPADRWLTRQIRSIANLIVRDRQRILDSYGSAPGHVV